MINLSLDELRLIAQLRNISNCVKKSKEDLIKALSESELETLKNQKYQNQKYQNRKYQNQKQKLSHTHQNQKKNQNQKHQEPEKYQNKQN